MGRNDGMVWQILGRTGPARNLSYTQGHFTNIEEVSAVADQL